MRAALICVAASVLAFCSGYAARDMGGSGAGDVCRVWREGLVDWRRQALACRAKGDAEEAGRRAAASDARRAARPLTPPRP